jgi:hypothetical protein
MRKAIAVVFVAAALASGQESTPGRPILKRGGPATQHEKSAEKLPPAPPKEAVYTEIEVDEEGRGDTRMTAVRSEDAAEELIERARAAAFEFNQKLPNFICDQLVLRYESKSIKPEWKLQDRVQVELTYAGGVEDYRNVRVNGKPLKKGSPGDSGTWSTGVRRHADRHLGGQ